MSAWRSNELSPLRPVRTRVRSRTQVHAVEHLVEGCRVLVVQATGWGKSAVYWAATAALRAKGAGPKLVVSPLLALMRDACQQIAPQEKRGPRIMLRWLGGFAAQSTVNDWAIARVTGMRLLVIASSLPHFRCWFSAVMQVMGSRGITKVGRGTGVLAPGSRSIPILPRLQKEQA